MRLKKWINKSPYDIWVRDSKGRPARMVWGAKKKIKKIKYLTYAEFNKAFKEVAPKIKEDWEKFLNEESPLAKLFDK